MRKLFCFLNYFPSVKQDIIKSNQLFSCVCMFCSVPICSESVPQEIIVCHSTYKAQHVYAVFLISDTVICGYQCAAISDSSHSWCGKRLQRVCMYCMTQAAALGQIISLSQRLQPPMQVKEAGKTKQSQ